MGVGLSRHDTIKWRGKVAADQSLSSVIYQLFELGHIN